MKSVRPFAGAHTIALLANRLHHRFAQMGGAVGDDDAGGFHGFDLALGVALAYAWVAFPYTLYALGANVNDGLVALMLVIALLVVSSPVAR